MSVRVGFLSAEDKISDLRTIFRQLALLWKFDLVELNPGEASLGDFPIMPFIIELDAVGSACEKAVERTVSKHASRCLFFSTRDKILGPAFSALCGVQEISWRRYHRDMTVRISAQDCLLGGISERLLLRRFDHSSIGNIRISDADVLLRTNDGTNILSRLGDCYTFALPVWQFGIVSFSAWYRILENALFFADDTPHVAPGPYVSFRIDDLPVTGESYLKQGYSDRSVCREIRKIQTAHTRYGARIEYMLSSHVLKGSCELFLAQTVAPRAFELLRELYQKGEINLGLHGRTHLDVDAYQLDGTIVPYEFQTLDKEQTVSAMRSLRQWLKASFGILHSGFVAPAWGYRPCVTKAIARRMFRYVADSNQHLQQSVDEDLFGSVCDGTVSMYETWRSGMSGVKMMDRQVFGSYLDAGLPIHLMLHGFRVRDPLVGWLKILLGVSAVSCFAIGDIWLALSATKSIVALALAPQVAMVWFALHCRRRLGSMLRLMMSKLPWVETVERLGRAASQAGAKWLFVEELADHMAGFRDISLDSPVRFGAKGIRVRITCRNSLLRPISVHFPFRVATIRASPKPRRLDVKGHVVLLGPLQRGVCDLSAQPIG